MKKFVTGSCGRSAILTIAAIKAAIEAFDRGEANAFDALDAVAVAVASHRAAMRRKPLQVRRPRDAA